MPFIRLYIVFYIRTILLLSLSFVAVAMALHHSATRLRAFVAPRTNQSPYIPNNSATTTV